MCKVKANVQVITKLHVAAMFALANADVLGIEEIENEYAPGEGASPWFKVLTPIGTIKIGNRKRVINIDWTDTDVRHVVTEDHVTKSETHVHAWSVGKAVNYLIALEQFVTMRASGATVATETDEE